MFFCIAATLAFFSLRKYNKQYRKLINEIFSKANFFFAFASLCDIKRKIVALKHEALIFKKSNNFV
jgi:hypothetical protein